MEGGGSASEEVRGDCERREGAAEGDGRQRTTAVEKWGHDSNKRSKWGKGSEDKDSKGKTSVVRGRMHSRLQLGMGQKGTRGDE